jgi:hypothetical protein
MKEASSMTMSNRDVIGALDKDERAIINERDRLRDEFFSAETDEERDRIMGQINDATRRYDSLRAAKWERGEVK